MTDRLDRRLWQYGLELSKHWKLGVLLLGGAIGIVVSFFGWENAKAIRYLSTIVGGIAFAIASFKVWDDAQLAVQTEKNGRVANAADFAQREKELRENCAQKEKQLQTEFAEKKKELNAKLEELTAQDPKAIARENADLIQEGRMILGGFLSDDADDETVEQSVVLFGDWDARVRAFIRKHYPLRLDDIPEQRIDEENHSEKEMVRLETERNCNLLKQIYQDSDKAKSNNQQIANVEVVSEADKIKREKAEQTAALKEFDRRRMELKAKLMPGKNQPQYTIDPGYRVPPDILQQLHSLVTEVDAYLDQLDEAWFAGIDRYDLDFVPPGQTHVQLRELEMVNQKLKKGFSWIANKPR